MFMLVSFFFFVGVLNIHNHIINFHTMNGFLYTFLRIRKLVIFFLIETKDEITILFPLRTVVQLSNTN